VQEHQQKGGFGSAVAEFYAKTTPIKQEFIGVNDLFGQSGTPKELVEHYEMGVTHIVQAAKRVIAR
jgi:transketolase